MAFFELKGIRKAYGTGNCRAEVLRGIDLSIEEGEFVAVVGFSGSGKSTLLSIMAGLIEPDGGEVLLRGRKVRGPGPERGVVFQQYALLPWLNVRENVALAVDKVFRHWTRARRREHVEEHLRLVNLSEAAHKKPRELSGGMRQRVALARGLAMDPEILLLDEPFGALDALTRATLQAEVARIWQERRKTVVLITNDVDEGILLADRIVPLTPGPQATLADAFEVNLARPRERRELNRLPEFQRIRNEVTCCLNAMVRTRDARPPAADAERTAAVPEPGPVCSVATGI